MLLVEDLLTLFNDLIADVVAMRASSHCTDVVNKAYLLERSSVLETYANLPPFVALFIQIDDLFTLQVHIDVRLKRFNVLYFLSVQVD